MEPRTMLSGVSLFWSDQSQLSVSMAADGTDIVGQKSELFETFDRIADRPTWQNAILSAFQEWTNHSNVDFAQVEDGGQDFGISGSRLNDPRFGDIRMGAIPLAQDVAAVSVSDDQILPGTWAGDIVFNSSASFQTADDIYAVALHEIGHVLGLSHNGRATSVMRDHNDFTTTGLDELDVAAIQGIHGVRTDDRFDSDASNNTLSTATPITIAEKGKELGTRPVILYGTLVDGDDIDHYRLSGHLKTGKSSYEGPITVRLQTDEISLLSPTLTVFDKNGNISIQV